MQKYENGANRVSFSRLVQIARALDCQVTDLTGAVDLLQRYEVMSPESRRLLVDLLQVT